MFIANLATIALSNVSTTAAWLFQEQAVGWDPLSLWHQMGLLAKAVVVILFIMSGWSIGVMIDRWMAFSAARKQSRAFAPAVAGALRDGKIDEAIKVAERNKKSHLAKVVTAGLMEFRAHQTRLGAHRSHRSRRIEARLGRPGNRGFDGPIRRTVRYRSRHFERLSRNCHPEANWSGRSGRRYIGGVGHDRSGTVGCHSCRDDV